MKGIKSLSWQKCHWICTQLCCSTEANSWSGLACRNFFCRVLILGVLFFPRVLEALCLFVASCFDHHIKWWQSSWLFKTFNLASHFACAHFSCFVWQSYAGPCWLVESAERWWCDLRILVDPCHACLPCHACMLACLLPCCPERPLDSVCLYVLHVLPGICGIIVPHQPPMPHGTVPPLPDLAGTDQWAQWQRLTQSTAAVLSIDQSKSITHPYTLQQQQNRKLRKYSIIHK